MNENILKYLIKYKIIKKINNTLLVLFLKIYINIPIDKQVILK